MECVIGLYKPECVRTIVFQPGVYPTISDVECATAGWVWCEQRGLHSSLGYLVPTEYEAAHYAALTREPQPAKAARTTTANPWPSLRLVAAQECMSWSGSITIPSEPSATSLSVPSPRAPS